MFSSKIENFFKNKNIKFSSIVEKCFQNLEIFLNFLPKVENVGNCFVKNLLRNWEF